MATLPGYAANVGTLSDEALRGELDKVTRDADESNYTAELFTAASTGHFDHVIAFLDHDADPNGTMYQPRTVLGALARHAATTDPRPDCTRVVRELVGKGASVSRALVDLCTDIDPRAFELLLEIVEVDDVLYMLIDPGSTWMVASKHAPPTHLLKVASDYLACMYAAAPGRGQRMTDDHRRGLRDRIRAWLTAFFRF